MIKIENHKRLSVTQWLHREIIEKKLGSPGGIVTLMLVATSIGYLLTNRDLLLIPFIITGIFLGLVVVYYCLFKPLTAYYLVTTIAFLAFCPDHLLGIDLPLSTLVEILLLFVFIGCFIFVKANPSSRKGIFNTPVSIALMIYTAYLICEMFNTNISDITGWFYTFKRFAVYIFSYFIAYYLIDTPEKFRYFLKYWIVFSFAAGLYGCYQQWFGYLPMEMRYIMRNPIEYKLLFQGGTLRKFSFLSDVVSFGILAGSMAVFTLLLAINEKRTKYKYTLWFFTIILVLGMLYSGTRTTYIMLPAGIALYALLTIQNKTTLTILFVSFVVVFLILFMPVDTPLLNRIRSTFNTKEASLNVRDMNRHYIQPYIYRHPFGGGVATSGADGTRFYPNHFLAGFPPDSGFLKVSLEQGWIGFALTIFYNLMILYQGIFYYFKMKNREYKIYVAALLASLFSIIVTQYAQVSVGQIPQALFIFSSISLMKRLLEFDEEESSTGLKEISLQNNEQ
jgi:putative inorganic carbon (HCO3(-)) transporter